MPDRTICLINDSFPPVTDGVANAVVNYAKNLTQDGKRATVVTPAYPDADDTQFGFPVVRYPRSWSDTTPGFRFRARRLKSSSSSALTSFTATVR